MKKHLTLDKFGISWGDEYSLPHILFFQALAERGNDKVYKFSYPFNKFIAPKFETPKGFDPIFIMDSEYSKDERTTSEGSYLYKDTPVYVSNFDDVVIYIGTDNKELIKEVVDIIKTALPEQEEAPDDSYDIGLWHLTGSGPKSVNRTFKEPPVDKIALNYNDTDREALDKLAAFKPTRGGEFLLLTGEPGTGKSHLLLSVFNSWKSWADFKYIVDPMTFFGGSAGYLMDMIYSGKGGLEYPSTSSKSVDKWQVILLEDAGELLTIDAKDKVGQGLSLFLNVTDGFIGKGAKVIIVLTTNETIGKLHPAVSRPGRCTFKHEFGRLSEDESIAWLTAMGKPEIAASQIDKGDHTLAELYALLTGNTEVKTQRPTKFGFGV